MEKSFEKTEKTVVSEQKEEKVVSSCGEVIISDKDLENVCGGRRPEFSR